MNGDTGHAGAVWDCGFAPYGDFYATAGRDRTVKLWDTGSARVITTLQGHDGEVGACRVGPTGRFVVSAGDDGQVIVWILGGIEVPEDVEIPEGRIDLMLGEIVTCGGDQRAHDAPATGCAISPDARLIASASADHTLKLWEPHSGRELAVLRGHDGPVTDCTFTPSGGNIVSASWDRTVKIWSLSTCEAQATLHAHADGVTSCAASPDLSYVASGSVDGTVALFDLNENQLTAFEAHEGPVLGCCFSPDGALIASVGADGILRLSGVPGGDEKAALALPAAPQCVAMHPFLPVAVCGDHAGEVHVVRLEGIALGPPAVTVIDAPDRPGDPVLLCPRCRTVRPDGSVQMGATIACPGCELQLRVNPFFASTSTPGKDECWRPFLAAPPPSDPPPEPGRRRFGRKRR